MIFHLPRIGDENFDRSYSQRSVLRFTFAVLGKEFVQMIRPTSIQSRKQERVGYKIIYFYRERLLQTGWLHSVNAFFLYTVLIICATGNNFAFKHITIAMASQTKHSYHSKIKRFKWSYYTYQHAKFLNFVGYPLHAYHSLA